jgi:cytochrome P450
LVPWKFLLTSSGPPAQFFFGNVLEMMDDPLETFAKYSQIYGSNGIFRYFYFTQPVVVVVHPELVKQVLSSSSKNFWKDQDPIILDVIGKGLLLSNGDLWKKQRKLMASERDESYEF